jgi:Tfp pilus assembly protein PilN
MFQRGSRCAGLYLWYGPDSELFASLVIAALRNDAVMIESALSSDSLEDIIRKVPGNIPLMVSLDGSHVVHRLVDNSSADNTLSSTLPGSGANDFYSGKHEAATERMIVSLIRKEEVYKLVGFINREGLLVFDLHLGPFSIDKLTGIAGDNGEIAILFYTLFLENGKTVSFERSYNHKIENIYSVEFGNEVVSSEFLVPLSLCYAFFRKDYTKGNNEMLAIQRKELAAKRILSATALPFLLLIFILLIVNFALLVDLDKKNRILISSVTVGKHHLTQIDSLRKALVIRQKILDARNNRGARYLAYFSDRIASCVPADITLSTLNIYPQKNINQRRNQYSFSDGLITISGFSGSTVSLEEYLENLSSLWWIESVRITAYSMDKDGNGIFNLEISVSVNQ